MMTTNEFNAALRRLDPACIASERQRLESNRQRMDAVRERTSFVCALREHGDLIQGDILERADGDPEFKADSVESLAGLLTAKYAKIASMDGAEAADVGTLEDDDQ